MSIQIFFKHKKETNMNILQLSRDHEIKKNETKESDQHLQLYNYVTGSAKIDLIAHDKKFNFL